MAARWKKFVRDNSLILLTLLGIVIGFSLGMGLQAAQPSEDLLQWIGLPGELFLRSLKATIVPIVVCMVITATASVDVRSNGRVAVVGFLTFLVTTLFAVVIAVVLFLMLRPEANSLSTTTTKKYGSRLQTQDVFLDLIRNIVPDNVVGAAISQTTTVYEPEELSTNSNSSSNATSTAAVSYQRTLGQASGVNILGLITICAAFGVAAKKTLPSDSAFLAFFRQGQEVTLVVMRWLAWTTPVGVASLIAKSIAGVSSLGAIFFAIGRLVICVISGLATHHLVVLPVLLFVLTRKNPIPYMMRTVRPYFVAFAACATSVALPHMLESCDQNGVSKRVSQFVIPMSVTLHADASALYIASASLFVAQTTSAESLDTASVFIIAALSGVLSLAIPPVPSASIVTVAIIMTSLNVPLQGIALLFTVEFLLDPLRSGVNAVSHVVCAVYTDAICGRHGDQETPELVRMRHNDDDDDANGVEVEGQNETVFEERSEL